MNQNIRKLLLTVCIAVTAFITKAQQITSPIELNDALVEVTVVLNQAGKEWGTAFKKANETNNFELLKSYRLNMAKLVDDKIRYVSNMKDIKNSKPLRDAFLQFLAYEKKLIAEAFVPFESLTSTSSEADRKKLLNQLATLASQETEKLRKIGETQEKYASENGFTIESSNE